MWFAAVSFSAAIIHIRNSTHTSSATTDRDSRLMTLFL
jgi:hypothetical protein